MASQIILIHLHLDFEKPLIQLLRKWNQAQNFVEFIGIRPSRKLEQTLLNPGSISDDEASFAASQIRTGAGFRPTDGIIVFTEKRLYDETYYQLFVGGRESDENPPNIGIISLHFLRHLYAESGNQQSGFFSAIISNILFSIGIDIGLDDHGDETRGCVMDFCNFMPDIDSGLSGGIKFCNECRGFLESHPKNGSAFLILADVFNHLDDIDIVEKDVTEAILLRGEQYSTDAAGFDYDVSLSFSGQDREYAEKLANQLKLKNIAVFYDKSEQADLWGKNLQTHLTELYRIRSRYCIILISANYITSRWTKVELDAALAREFERDEVYILPIKIDDTSVSGLLPTRGFIDARQESIENIAALVKSKLELERSIGFQQKN